MTTCTWPISYAGCGATPGDPEAVPPIAPSTGCEALDELTPEQRAVFEQMASDYLWEATGGVYGACETIVRPCGSDCEGGRAWASTFWGRGPYPWSGTAGSGAWLPALVGGEWLNVGCACASACNCATSAASALRLPGPIAEVLSVTIDGVVLDPAEYVVMYGDVLVRVDGTAWPSCQNLLAPATDLDTFEVAYMRGADVPVGGQVAAGKLACEFALAACDDSACALPERIQSFTRQGVTASFFLSGEKWQETGIWIIDSWVASVTRSRSRPTVRNIDVPRRRSTTTGGRR